jgi:hypothetical protein
MKKLTLLVATLLTLGLSSIGYAQQQTSTVPHAFKYQAVARDSKGDIISNQNVSFRISILQGSETGTLIYQESQTATTNQFGLSNLSIGTGNVLNGNFNTIEWGASVYFVKVEFDPQGGTNYTAMGTSQMLSVPYALYSEKSGSVDNFPTKAALQGTNLAAPLTNPETGMLVYNTDSTGTGPNSVVPGYYYNAGLPTAPIWVLLSGGAGDKNKGIHPPQAESTNTTYGGLVQDGNGNNALFGEYVSAPSGSYNTGFGDRVFGSNASTNPSGNYNTGVGYNALNAITSATENTAVGTQALYSTTTGSYNTAMGLNSMYYNVTGEENVALGFGTLFDNTASGNTATGYDAMNVNTTGTGNVANGYYALLDNTTGDYNTAIGSSALSANTTNSNNTAVGYQALKSTTGGSNTAIGSQALYSNTGSENVAVGDQAVYSNVTGVDNVGVGLQALFYTTGSNNVGMGESALLNNAAGGDNTGIGTQSLSTNTTGTDNTGIGALSNVASGGLTNATAIGFSASVAASNTVQLGNTSVVNVNIAGALSVPTQSSSATSGSITVTQGVQALILTGGGSNTTITINFPSSPVNGQIFCITGSTGFSTPTFSSGGNTFDSAPASITAHTGYRFILIGTVWYNL